MKNRTKCKQSSSAIVCYALSDWKYYGIIKMSARDEGKRTHGLRTTTTTMMMVKEEKKKRKKLLELR